MSANIKASVDGTQAIIGVGGVDQMTVSNAGVVTANSFVGAMNGSSVTATGSTTARTLANRFADVVNVKDFGAVGDGVADDTAAIQAAMAASFYIYFPKGRYKYNSTTLPNIGNFPTTATNPFFGEGELLDSITNDVVGINLFVGNKNTQHNRTGKLIYSYGKTNIADTGIPTLNPALFEEYGYKSYQQEGGWLFMNPARGGSQNVVEIQAGAVKTEVTTQSGTSFVNYVLGDGLLGGYIIDTPVLITYQNKKSVLLLVKSTSVGQLEVKNFNGSSYVFSTTEPAYIFNNNNLNHCIANVIGNKVYFLKNPNYETPQFVFPGFSITNQHIRVIINSVVYVVTGIDTNPDVNLYHQVLIVSGTPPTGNNIKLTQSHYWDWVTGTRIKPVNGGGAEGGLDLSFRDDGMYHATTVGSSPQYNRPLLIGTIDGNNGMFFSANQSATPVQSGFSQHISDSADFFGFIDPSLPAALNSPDNFKLTIRRDTNDAPVPGGTNKTNYFRVWGRFAGSNHRGISIFGYNDGNGLNIQGFGYSDAPENIRLNAAGGNVWIRTKETAFTENIVATGSVRFIDNSTTTFKVNNNGSNTIFNIANLPTSSVGLSAGDIWNSSGTLRIV